MPRTMARGRFLSLGVGVLLLAAAHVAAVKSSAAAEQGAQARARQILAATGVRGGLIVHVGCGDGTLTAALRANDGTLVHGLDADPANVEKARAHIRSLGLYGKVSVERWAAKGLPYTDNLVNLLVADEPGWVAMDEVMRVLCPDGVAYTRNGGKWTKAVKPRPANIDEWTHTLHDASNNAVASDAVVGPPRHVQWVGGPKFARPASASPCRAAGGFSPSWTKGRSRRSRCRPSGSSWRETPSTGWSCGRDQSDRGRGT